VENTIAQIRMLKEMKRFKNTDIFVNDPNYPKEYYEGDKEELLKDPHITGEFKRLIEY
jgi:murein L,D-transpeptidase YcbB/YkuD